MASPIGDNDAGGNGQKISFKLQSRDLPSGRLLGKGLSGIAYETLWKGDRFARKDFLGVPKGVFEKEAAVLVGLKDHRNIVKTFGWTTDKRSCSLVLEYMEDDLLSLLQKRTEIKQDAAGSGSGNQSDSTSTSSQPFNLPEALDIILQIARGLECLHEQGVAHGDLKTKNILVTHMNDGDQNLKVVKVSDFGLIWTKKKSKSIVSPQVRKLDMIQWKAPEYLTDIVYDEQLNLRNDKDETSSESDSASESEKTSTRPVVKVDVFAADVYSFAGMCLQILTGIDPYPNLDSKDLGYKILCGLRPKLPDACPPRLRTILTSCWDDDPAKRPTFSVICMWFRYWELLITDPFTGIGRTTGAMASFEPRRTQSRTSQLDQVDREHEHNHKLASPTGLRTSSIKYSSRAATSSSKKSSSKKSSSKKSPSTSRQCSGLSISITRDERDNYRGVRCNWPNDNYVAEILPLGSMEAMWLGTYDTKEEAARAFDIGILCCNRELPLNFPDSRSMLRKFSGSNLPPAQDGSAISKLAQDFVRAVGARTSSTGTTDCDAAVKAHDTIQRKAEVGTVSDLAALEPVNSLPYFADLKWLSRSRSFKNDSSESCDVPPDLDPKLTTSAVAHNPPPGSSVLGLFPQPDWSPLYGSDSSNWSYDEDFLSWLY